VGVIRCLGEESAFEMTPDEYVEKLETSIHKAAGPKIELRASAAAVRNAISRISSPTVRRMTTSAGWTDDRSTFLVPGGWVDALGYHDIASNPGSVEVDLEEQERARWLGFRSLTSEQLMQVNQHISTDFLRLHDQNVMLALLGAVALAPMLRFAGIASRPLLWLQGLTGHGKSFIGRFAMSFFGDFETPLGERYMSWKSTGNILQKAGFFFRDMLYLVDDYKREDCRNADVLKVLRCYSDGAARSRLRTDASMNSTQPIRGLLLSTGEDFPEATASAMGRSIVIRVPGRPKDFELARSCQEMRSLYKGFTPALIASVIRDARWDWFSKRVEFWRKHYYDTIAGCTNDARIAGNHASLAAAVELVSDFLGDIWCEAAEVAGRFNQEFLLTRVLDSAGEVEQETPARIFLDTLDELIAYSRVRIEGLGPWIDNKSRDRDKIVGRLFDSHGHGLQSIAGREIRPDDVVGLSMPLALEAVQETLLSQGRQRLQISIQTLLDQLAASGFLLDKNNNPISKESTGEKTWKERLGGQSRNLARIRADAFPSQFTPPAPEHLTSKQLLLTPGMADAAMGSEGTPPIIQFPASL
jgi:hypothetical protein